VSDFPTALDAALSGYYGARDDYRSPIESTRGFQARTRALEKAYGSKAAAARAAGIDPNTWSRWTTKGRAPSRASLGRIAAAHFALLRAAKVAKKGYPSRFDITATVACHPVGSKAGRSKKATYYNGGSSNATRAFRKFRADKLSATQVRGVVGAWAAGQSPDDVAGVLLREVERAYPGRFEFEGTNVTVEIN
jgi:hypothetical protein